VKGHARTTGAISVVNALPTGIGCAVGIALPVEASVEIDPGRPGLPTLAVDGAERSPLIEESVSVGLSTFVSRPDARASVSVRSSIPIARGLKSSSAVGTAIILALARAAGQDPGPLDVGRLAAEAGRKAGVSATGALDDALASLGSGFVVTDNARGAVLHRAAVDPDWGVLLYIPSAPHPPSPSLRDAFARETPAGTAAASAAVRGEWALAMRLNTELVERVMGYSYASLRGRLRDEGAVASGVSGLGPTLAAIGPIARLPAIERALPADDAQRIVIPFVRGPTEEAPTP